MAEISPVPLADWNSDSAERPANGSGWILSLDNNWCRCDLESLNGSIFIDNAHQHILAKMSGSPIMGNDGKAIGILACSQGDAHGRHTGGGPHPRLTHHLPGWIVQGNRL